LHSAVSAPAHSSAHGFAIAGAQRLAPDGTQTVDQEARLADDRVARFVLAGLSAIDTAAKSVFARNGWPLRNIEELLRKSYSDWLEIINP
jgi:hypothetical protein